MRVAVVSTMDLFDWGGSEELWAAMARAARQAGHDVLASVNQWRHEPAAISDLKGNGVRVSTRSRLRQRLRYRLTPLPALPLSLRVIERFRPDVVCLSHGATWDVPRDAGLFASVMRLVDRGKVPYVPVCQYNTAYEPLTEPERDRARRYFQAAATVVFVSTDNKAATERQLAVDLPRAVVLQNPLTLEPGPLPWPADGPAALGCVGRLEAGAKGQDVLLEALAAEAWRRRDWRLDLYGAGPHAAWLDTLARRFELDGRVRFHGHVEDVRQIWRHHHILVLSSRAEGTPLALLEAMACGRPAVVTDVGGNTEWVTDGETGFVAAAATVRALADALDRAWAVRDRWPEMGMAAHDLLVRRYEARPGHALLRLIEDARAG